jgi:hypothetical protein
MKTYVYPIAEIMTAKSLRLVQCAGKNLGCAHQPPAQEDHPRKIERNSST